MFTPNVFDLLIQIYLSQIQACVTANQTLSLLFKRLALVNELDGRDMLSVKPVLKNELNISDRKDANPFTKRIIHTKGLEV